MQVLYNRVGRFFHLFYFKNKTNGRKKIHQTCNDFVAILNMPLSYTLVLQVSLPRVKCTEVTEKICFELAFTQDTVKEAEKCSAEVNRYF